MNNMNNQIEDWLKSTAILLKSRDNIVLNYTLSYEHFAYQIELYLNGYHIRRVIPLDVLKTSSVPTDILYTTVAEMVEELLKHTQPPLSPTTNVYVGSGGGGGGYSNATTRINPPTRKASNMTIPLPDGWLSEELNMTKARVGFEKGDRDRILQIKQLLRDKYRQAFVTTQDTSYIAGGAFASLWHNEVPKDFDLFFINNTEGFDILNNPRFKETFPQYMSNPNIKRVVLDTQTNIQYIYTNYASREQLIGHFDMLHCCVSYDFKDDKLFISPVVLDTIKRKVIRHNGGNMIAEWRYEKMIKRGWKNEAVGI